MRKLAMILVGALAFLGLPAWAQDQSPPYEIEVVAEGLVYPWSLAFLPGGDALLTERPGQLRILSADGSLSEPLAGVPEVFFVPKAQSGLFDVVLHPEFATNRLIYLAYAWGDAEANATRLIRARLGEGAIEDVEVLFTSAPVRSTAAHYGGRVIFLLDGTLVLTLGDGFNYREQAQNLSNHLGAFVRLNDDGTVPADNPFVGQDGAQPEIWTYGHRNAQGLAADPLTGAVYASEHGPRGGDEINLMQVGANYGWPFATDGLDYTGQRVTPFTDYPGTEGPLHIWTPSIAPSGLAVYRGQMFPEWEGDLLAGALIAGDAPEGVTGHVRRVDLEGGAAVGEDILFAEIGERIRDVRVAPDGSIWILTDAKDQAPFSSETLYSQVLRITRSQ